MADCKELKGALDNLSNRVGDFDRRLKDAEKCCNDNKNNNKNNKDQNLDEILKRLNELEDAVRRIASYIDKLESAIKSAIEPLKLLANLFNIF